MARETENYGPPLVVHGPLLWGTSAPRCLADHSAASEWSTASSGLWRTSCLSSPPHISRGAVQGLRCRLLSVPPTPVPRPSRRLSVRVRTHLHARLATRDVPVVMEPARMPASLCQVANAHGQTQPREARGRVQPCLRHGHFSRA